jgi:hypothetical protein
MNSMDLTLSDISCNTMIFSDISNHTCIQCNKLILAIKDSNIFCQCIYKLYLDSGNINPNTDMSCIEYLDASSQPTNIAPHKYYYKPRLTYINAYTTTEQQVLSGGPVIFDTHSEISGDCMHFNNSSELWFWKSGCYYIYTSIYHLEACQFAVIKNDIDIIPASTVGSLYGASQNSTIFIANIKSSDIILQTDSSNIGLACKIQLVNTTANSPYVTLYGSNSAGNTLPQITSTITIMEML